MSKLKLTTSMLLIFLYSSASLAADDGDRSSNEVIRKTSTQVVVRIHSKTSRPYVSITPAGVPLDPKSVAVTTPITRPDYRMLDPKIKNGQIPYEGPSSNRTKIYVFAGTLAALGIAGGAVAIAAPAASTSAAGGGAGVFAGAGAGTAAGTISGVLSQDSEPSPENNSAESISKATEFR